MSGGFGQNYPDVESPPPYDDDGPVEFAGFAFVRGGTFILDVSPDPEPLWGSGSDVLLADGEALIIAGGQGLGKTTLAQQFALGRCGFAEYADLLGYPIQPGNRRTLYLAMDRPRQAARSMRRMVGDSWRDELDDRLVVWPGPPPADLAKYPHLLLQLCERAEADTVIMDSLKDAALGLKEDETGAGYNRARQTAIAAGVQMLELHHNRKTTPGISAAASLDSLYGSTWLPSGAGSVLLLSGEPGDPIVGLHHCKQPVSEVGPLRVLHNHETGRSVVWHSVDVLALALAAPSGLSATEAACAMFETEKPSAAEKEKARRKLATLQEQGSVKVLQEGDRAANLPMRWGRP